MPNLGEVFPNFKADTTQGKIDFHEWLGGSWALLFSHPADFTPVCTTEFAKIDKQEEEYAKRGVKLIGLSCNSVESHIKWAKDVRACSGKGGDSLAYPIIADEKRHIAVQLGMIDPDEKDAAGLPLTARAVFVIGPDKKMKLSILYPATTGRNYDEVLRVIDSLQLTATKKVATPVNWQPGAEVMVLPTVKPEEIPALFPNGVRVDKMPSGKEYMRFTKV